MTAARTTLRDARSTGQLAAECPATAGLLAWLTLSAAMQPDWSATTDPAVSRGTPHTGGPSAVRPVSTGGSR
ncbi:hypothetical protein [Streptomyces sp. YIM S03343]